MIATVFLDSRIMEVFMKRWHQELAISIRNWKNRRRMEIDSAKRHGAVGRDPFDTGDKELGRYRKKDAYDCGNTKCYICSCDKLLGHKHEQEVLSDLDFAEQLKELE